MSSKFLINLENIPFEGESFEFKAEQILKCKNLEEFCQNDSSNFIELFVQPIDGAHFSVKGSVNLVRPYNCSRCGEDMTKPTKIDVDDFLSTEVEAEGEDQGFYLVKSGVSWDSSEFIREMLILETPIQIYKYGEKCLQSCPHYEEALKNGWLSDPEEKTNPFAELEKIKGKLQ